MNVLQPIYIPSSKPTISGMPSWLSKVERLSKTVPDGITNAALITTSDLQRELREELLTDISWAPYAETVRLDYVDGEIILYADSEEAVLLEYGAPGVPMNSKLRPFIRRAAETLADRVTDALMKVSK